MVLEITPYFMMAVPVVIALVSVMKIYLDAYYAPLMAIASGLVVVYLLSSGLTMGEMIIQGLLVGLTASGLYSGSKTLGSRFV